MCLARVIVRVLSPTETITRACCLHQGPLWSTCRHLTHHVSSVQASCLEGTLPIGMTEGGRIGRPILSTVQRLLSGLYPLLQQPL